MDPTFYKIQKPTHYPLYYRPAFQIAQPVTGLPGIECKGDVGSCGNTWAHIGRRLRRELPSNHPLLSSDGWPVSPQVFREITDNIRETLTLPASVKLDPGTRLGHLRLECKNRNVCPLEWPEGEIESIAITDELRVRLEAQSITGWHVENVHITKSRTKQLPLVHELLADSVVRAFALPERPIRSQCSICGRIEYEAIAPESIEIDWNTWNGSDFIDFTPPLGRWFVSDKCKSVLQRLSSDSIQFIPLDQVIQKALQDIPKAIRDHEQAQNLRHDSDFERRLEELELKRVLDNLRRGKRI